MRSLLLPFVGLLFSVGCAATSPEDLAPSGAATASDALSTSDVGKLAGRWKLGETDGRVTTDAHGDHVRHYSNPANPNATSSYVISDRSDRNVLRITVADPAGDDFVIDGVFLQVASMFDLHDIGAPSHKDDQLTWDFGQGDVDLRDPAALCSSDACSKAAAHDLAEAMAAPKPHKLGSSAGFVTGITVGDGIDPAYQLDEASVWLAYHYRTKLGQFKFGPSDEGTQVFDGGKITVFDEGNVITYTVSLTGIGEVERCMTSAVQPDYVCHAL
jgi:hypothetical protein